MRNRVKIAFAVEPGGKKVLLKVLVFLYETLPHEDGIIGSQDDSFSSCLFFNIWGKLKSGTLEEGTLACLTYLAPLKT